MRLVVLAWLPYGPSGPLWRWGRGRRQGEAAGRRSRASCPGRSRPGFPSV